MAKGVNHCKACDVALTVDTFGEYLCRACLQVEADREHSYEERVASAKTEIENFRRQVAEEYSIDIADLM